jgi:vesicular inhibitory amino acid transporter
VQLFNSIAILLGIGMLSEPLAFAYAGWGMGLVLIIFYGYISCYTCVSAARPVRLPLTRFTVPKYSQG